MLGTNTIFRQTTCPSAFRVVPPLTILSILFFRKLWNGIVPSAATRYGSCIIRRGASSMSQPYVGQILMFGCNFAPAGWAIVHGQLMPISENEALFQLIGTTYGGDGQETFGLPDLQGRVPVHMGQGPGIYAELPDRRNGGRGERHADDAADADAQPRCPGRSRQRRQHQQAPADDMCWPTSSDPQADSASSTCANSGTNQVTLGAADRSSSPAAASRTRTCSNT